jgi:hypothetical protein
MFKEEGGIIFMTLSVSGTWGISEFKLYLTGEKSEFFYLWLLEVLSGNICGSGPKNIRVSVYGVMARYDTLWHVLPFIKLKVSNISASCSDPASPRNKFNLQVPWLLCIISHRYQYQYSASLNKAINHRVNTSHGESLLCTKII